jgi:hypothetical protein
MMRPELNDALAAFSDDVSEAIDADDLELMLYYWRDCQTIVSSMRLLESLLEGSAIPLIPWAEPDPERPKMKPHRETVTVDGVGDFTVTSKSVKTTWDQPGTLRAVVRSAMDAGQIAHPNDVADVLAKVARLEFRVTALTELGIDPDDEDDPLREVDRSGVKLRLL